MSAELSLFIGLISFGIITIYIAMLIFNLFCELRNPRWRIAVRAKRLLKAELGIRTNWELKPMGGDIVLTCRKETLAEIQPRKDEIRKALKEFPDVISLEERRRRAQIILVEPPRAGKREEEKRPAPTLRPVLN